MQNRVKYQSKLVTVSSGASAGAVQEDDIQLDQGYHKCTGIAVHEISDGTIANGYYEVGIKDQNRVYHDLAHIDNWDGGAGVAPNLKFKDIYIPVKSSSLTQIQTKTPATNAADLIYQVVFRLEKEGVVN